MNELLPIMVRHGYGLIFAVLMAEALGFPLPASIAMVAAGAAIASHTLWAPGVICAALLGLLLGDSILFWLGRYSGWALLALLCRLSMNPETCILRSAESFYKRGKGTLLIGKFIPGLNAMAAPLAGSMNMRYVQFLEFDVIGASLYSMSYLLVGYLARDLLAAILRGITAAGRAMEVAIGVALIIYAGYRVIQFANYRRYDLVPRVQVKDLIARIASDSQHLQIVDVRSHGYYDKGAERIAGSIRIEPNNLEEEIKNLPKEKELYLYCT
ncbi:MAG TPA: VTT domain-containing protein [Verrucomicrobiae bacterium]|jgi:membrane protein DedA with SNARE-associated domain|nr:VTT domain-containing protein [Verrucomicrobiae bacterium]